MNLRVPTPKSKALRPPGLRAENQDLPRLRNQVTQLQAANQKLSGQLKDTATHAQQAQAQLQQVAAARQAETQRVNAEAEHDACINNLRQIDAAKQQWALEKNKTAEAIPTAQEIAPYFKNSVLPVCPSGGTYTLNGAGLSAVVFHRRPCVAAMTRAARVFSFLLSLVLP
ncbi:MAG: hypothetical protein WDN00_03480 [Limisphaerales bacterium]